MTSSPRTGGRLIAASALLACGGILLLCAGLRPHASAPAPRPALAAVQTAAPRRAEASPAPTMNGIPTSPPPTPGGQSTSEPANTAGPAAATASTAPSAGAPLHDPLPLPHPGSSEAADRSIQQAMGDASRQDLAPGDEELLLHQGRAAWLAETTEYTQVRIQAATARRDTASSTDTGGRAPAVVRLVWAGADPAGTFLDGRTAAVHFTQNGYGSWNRTP